MRFVPLSCTSPWRITALRAKIVWWGLRSFSWRISSTRAAARAGCLWLSEYIWMRRAGPFCAFSRKEPTMKLPKSLSDSSLTYEMTQYHSTSSFSHSCPHGLPYVSIYTNWVDCPSCSNCVQLIVCVCVCVGMDYFYYTMQCVTFTMLDLFFINVCAYIIYYEQCNN